MNAGWAIVVLALASWVWSKFFAPFPDCPPVAAKVDDKTWHEAADRAQSQRTQTLTVLWVVTIVVVGSLFLTIVGSL